MGSDISQKKTRTKRHIQTQIVQSVYIYNLVIQIGTHPYIPWIARIGHCSIHLILVFIWSTSSLLRHHTKKRHNNQCPDNNTISDRYPLTDPKDSIFNVEPLDYFIMLLILLLLMVVIVVVVVVVIVIDDCCVCWLIDWLIVVEVVPLNDGCP